MASDVNAPIDGLDVPIAWLSAEHTAQQLISDHYPLWSPALFQYRTVQYALALTVFLSEGREPDKQSAQWPAHRWAALRDRTSSAHDWAQWCGNRLQQPVTGSLASQRMARSAWHWLRGSRLLYGSDCTADCGTGLYLGVNLAHRALDQHYLR